MPSEVGRKRRQDKRGPDEEGKKPSCAAASRAVHERSQPSEFVQQEGSVYRGRWIPVPRSGTYGRSSNRRCLPGREQVRAVPEPPKELPIRDHSNLGGSLPDGNALRGNDDHDAGDLNCRIHLAGEEFRRPGGLVARVIEMALFLPGHHQGPTRNPNGLPGVVLGIEGKYAGRTYQYVINVGRTRAHRHDL